MVAESGRRSRHSTIGGVADADQRADPEVGRRRVMRLLPVVLFALLLVTPAGCTESGGSGGTGAAGGERVTVGSFGGVYSAIVYVAQERGYFADEGLDVSLVDYESGAAAVQDLIAGKVDLATAAGFVVTSNLFEHPELRVVTSLSTIKNNMMIVARADRGISEPSDLAGKTVAVTPKTQAQFFLETHLLLHLVPREEVDVRLMSPSECAAALEAGDVDAVMLWQPNAGQLIEHLGAGATVAWDGQDGQELFWLLVGTENSVSARPEVTESFVRALQRAQEELRVHPEKAQAAVVAGSSTAAAYVAGVWPDFRFELALDQSLVSSFEEEALWMVESGMVSAQTPPDPLTALYFPALENVSPEAVTVIR